MTLFFVSAMGAGLGVVITVAVFALVANKIRGKDTLQDELLKKWTENNEHCQFIRQNGERSAMELERIADALEKMIEKEEVK